MLLTCPSCGTRASAEAWENEADTRKAFELAASLPRPVAAGILRYCGLFRNPSAVRAMSWKKAVRIIGEIAELTAKGHVQAKGQVARPCSPDHWAAAMEKMVEIAEVGKLTLPLKGHNYLLSIVWQEADAADSAAEVTGRVRNFPPVDTGNDLSRYDRDYIAKHGEEAWEALGAAASKLPEPLNMPLMPRIKRMPDAD